MTKVHDQETTAELPQRANQAERQRDSASWLYPMLQLQRSVGNQAIARLIE